MNTLYLTEKYREHASDLTIRIFEKSCHTTQFEEHDNFDDKLIKWLDIPLHKSLATLIDTAHTKNNL